jgi:hypothetical protein
MIALCIVLGPWGGSASLHCKILMYLQFLLKGNIK